MYLLLMHYNTQKYLILTKNTKYLEFKQILKNFVFKTGYAFKWVQEVNKTD